MTGVIRAEINGAKVEIAPDYDAMSDRLAAVFIGAVALNPNLNVITPTGSSPTGWYQRNIEHVRANPRFFNGVTFNNLDEYCTVNGRGCELLAEDDPRSYQFYMQQYSPLIGVKANYLAGAENFRSPGQYDRQIEARGGIDFAVTGLGLDHACGFNFAGSPIDSVTRHVVISETTRQQNGDITDTDVMEMPTDAITMGVGTVLKAREIWTIASGTSKQEPVYQALFDPVSADNPATFLRRHPNHTLLIDEAAASLLEV